MKTTLEASGVTTSILNAHAVRRASSSKAANMRISTNDILKAADYQFSRNFNFGRAMLTKETQNLATNNTVVM